MRSKIDRTFVYQGNAGPYVLVIPVNGIIPDSLTLHYSGKHPAQESYIPLDLQASLQYQKDLKTQL